PPCPTPFPYTTLFRSWPRVPRGQSATNTTRQNGKEVHVAFSDHRPHQYARGKDSEHIRSALFNQIEGALNEADALRHCCFSVSRGFQPGYPRSVRPEPAECS